MWILHLFLGVFASVGLFMMGKGLVSLRDASESVHWPRTMATVTESRVVESRGQKGGYTYRPEVAYRYTLDGVEHTGSNLFFGSLISSSNRARSEVIVAKYPVGQVIEIAHHPRMQERSVVETGASKRTWGTFLIGMLFFSAGVQFWLIFWTQMSD